jgi:Flp pilus assembly pilin Flp
MSTLLLSVYCYFKNLFNEESGQDLIEYALIIALFVLVAALALGGLAGPVGDLWQSIADNLGGAGG